MNNVGAMVSVPAIDIGPFLANDPAGRKRVVADVKRACEEIGFVLIAGHGIPRTLLDTAFSTALEFFSLPFEEKLRYKPGDGGTPRGFSHARKLAKTLGLDTPPDLREQFYIGPLDDFRPRYKHIPQAEKFYIPNIWPERPASYKPVMTELYRGFERLSRDLMRIFAAALDVPEEYFLSKVDAHFATCPVNYYPPPEVPPEPGQLRAGAHTDFGALTILAMNDAPGGLQVMMRDEQWHDVKPAREHLVINLGDMMSRWTNDRWRSTLHRVVNPPWEIAKNSLRQTIAFFLHPNYDAMIECVPSCLAPGETPKYPPIMAGEHMRWKLENR